MSEITFTPQPQVRIPFRIGDFADCLYKSPAEYAAMSEAALRAEMQARYDAHQAALAAPLAPPEPEELQAQLDALAAQLTSTTDQIVALAPPEVAVPILEGQSAALAEQIAALTTQE